MNRLATTTRSTRNEWTAFLATLLALLSPAAMGAEHSPRLLMRDGAFREGKAEGFDDDGVDVLLDGVHTRLPWDRLDPAQQYRIRNQAIDAEKRGAVRARFDLAKRCREWGFNEYGRRQILAIARERLGLAEVAAIWLRDFPFSEAGKQLAEGLDAMLEDRKPEAYGYFTACQESSADGSEEERLSKQYLLTLLRIITESGEALPMPRPEPTSDPVLRGRLTNIKSWIVAAGEGVKEADDWYQRGNISRMRRHLELAETTLDKALSECAALKREMPDRADNEELASLVHWALGDLLRVHLTAARHFVEKRLYSDAERSIGKALALDGDNATALELQRRLARLGGDR